MILEDKDLDIKIAHIKNINSKLDLNSKESDDHVILALMLYKVLRKWGLHFLPHRFLYDLDMMLTEHLQKLREENGLWICRYR